MGLQETLTTDMKAAMKARDKQRLSAVRLLLSEVKNARIEKGSALEEAEELVLLSREAKRRRESIEAYNQGGREDLAAVEASELAVIEGYLPKGLTAEELQAVVTEVIAEVGATSRKDMGKVMSTVMPRVAGRADGKAIKNLVMGALS